MMVQTSLTGWQNILNLGSFHIYQVLFKYGFSETLLKKTTRALVFRNYPVGLNLVPSLKFWILKTNLSFHENKPLRLVNFNRASNLIENRYYKSTPYFLSRSTTKIFKQFLTKFFRIIPLSWVQ